MGDKNKLFFLFFLFLTYNIPLAISQYDQNEKSFKIQYADTLYGEFKILSVKELKKKYVIECRKGMERRGTWNGTKKVKRAYLIQLEGEESFWYLIISLHSGKKGGKEIEIGKRYAMTLYPKEKMNWVANHTLIFDIVIDGMLFCVPSEGWASNVYITPNLKGLRYISP